MNNSPVFYTDCCTQIQDRVREFLSQQGEFLSPSTRQSTRAAGDAIQQILSDSFDQILGDLCQEYSTDFARRAMADLAFTDTDGFYYVVDVKTHRLDTRFNMPNLTSVERLTRFYESDKNYFVVLMVSYNLNEVTLDVSDVLFVPIEFLGWDCLTIGALGWGQIQIASASSITVNPGYSRRDWMLEFCDIMLAFYPREIDKIHSRMERFQEIKQYWLAKPAE